MKYRLPRKLKKAVKKCIIISDVDTNSKLTTIRVVGNVEYVGRHTKHTKKVIRILRQRDYDALYKQLVNILNNSYDKSINKENLKFSNDLYDWDYDWDIVIGKEFLENEKDY